MLKRLVILVVAFAFFALLSGCKQAGGLIAAAPDLYKAGTITNDELIQMSKEMRAEGDKENKVAPAGNKYAARLNRITGKFKKEDGLDLNFKVYITPDINANATADGSVRVYSGLMDMMTDNELIFVIGHEIGHVKDGDSLDKVRMAYASSGILKGAGAAGLTSSQNSDLLHAVLNGQFSQKQESDADAYGYNLMKKYKFDTKAAVGALKKLAELDGGGKASLTSSHPGSNDRANAIQKMIDADKKK
ncbi:hypothetical protein FACS1894168_1800 [Deltaproteobacteria bacterium]|nr:hypothetical protein FACS1894168_1800 [Deltaproteobacteria bacterium]